MASSKKTGSDLWRILFVPDAHHPYVDVRAWRLMLKCARIFKPQSLIVLGDFGDYYCTSRHTKDPNRTRDLSVELRANNLALDELDALCASVGCKDKRFIKGNHEFNVSRYLAERAPELYNVVSVEKKLRLAARGWAVTQYKEFTRIGKLYCTHDSGSAGALAHIKTANDFMSNAIIGHTHRIATHYSTNILGKAHVASMVGWLGDKKAAEYMYKVKTRDWCLGFGIGYMEPNGTVHIQPVPIIDYRCVLGGPPALVAA